MTKIPATNFTATGLQFVYSTDDADPFDRDEVNLPAQALDQHTHASTLGLPVMRLGSGVQAAGPMLLADGAAATPSLAFQNAPTTGLFQSGGVLHITTGGTDRWQVNASGHLLATTDSALDIGAIGTNRPRHLFMGGTLYNGTRVESPLFYANDGSAAAPGYAFNAGGTGTGMFRATDQSLALSASGTEKLRIGGIATIFSNPLVFGATTTSGDTYVLRDGAANTLAQRNGANNQTLNIYSTYTDASNYERLGIFATTGGVYIRTEKAGTGAARTMVIWAGLALYLGGNASQEWVFPGNGRFMPTGDITADLGVGSNNLRNIYCKGANSTGGKAGAAVDGDIVNPQDGMIRYDSTNNRLYIRIGGVWKYAALT